MLRPAGCWSRAPARPYSRRVIGRDYPAPVVDHKRERQRALERYHAARGE
jgi:deoxyribodipyrimidine photolyase